MRCTSLVLFVGTTAALLGCPAEQTPTAATTAAAATAATAAPQVPKVARIVFMDKEDACACTRERADKSWAELQAALGADSALPVERVYIDTQAEKAAPYLALQDLMVVPGVYLLSAGDKLIELLQGEVTQDQLRLKLGL